MNIFKRNRGKIVALQSTMFGVKPVYENDFDPFKEKNVWKIRAWLIFSPHLAPIWITVVGFPLIVSTIFRSLVFLAFVPWGLMIIVLFAMASPWWNRIN
jgi:hypothetical protein